MSDPDLNLLVALDVLLEERSVAGAARRTGLSSSAMSRTLARLRACTGDPLLVRAGRGLAPTPRALALRADVGRVVAEARALLRPARVDVARVARTLTLRTGEGFVETFGPALLERLVQRAPGVRLRFVPRLARDPQGLRDGTVDLEVGVVGADSGTEVRARSLYRDRLVGVVRPGHPLLEALSVATWAAGDHVEVAQHTGRTGPIDEALAAAGASRDVVAVVGGFATALALARSAGLIATVPERTTAGLRADLRCFALPFEVPAITVSLMWHPRMDADPVHRWLRGELREVCGQETSPTTT